MLQSMRSGARHWVVGILFGLLILSFAIWGIGDIFRGGGKQTTIATVGPIEIGERDFVREYQRQLARLRQQLGGQIDERTLNQLGLGRQVAQQMVNRVLYQLAAHDLGLRVPDEAVARRIRSNPAFSQGKTGFNQQLYEQILRQNELTPATYEGEVRRDIGVGYLHDAVAGVETVPKSYAERIYRYEHEKRRVRVVAVPVKPDAVAAPDAAAVKSYYDAHKQEFMAPEYRKIVAIVIKPKDVMPGIEVTDKELHDAYENRKADFSVPEKRTVEQMVFAKKEEAEKARKMLESGKGFDEVAKASGISESQRNLGTVTKSDLLPELADPVFSLKPGTYTGPIKSPLGWHIVEVTHVQPGQTRSFAEVRDKLAQDIKRDKATDVIYKLVNNVEDELAAGSTYVETGRKLDVPVVQLDAVDADGRTPAGEKAKGLPEPSKKFLETAFSVDDGQESDVIDTEDGGVFMLKVQQVTPSAVKPLDKVHDKVVAAWKQEKAREQAHKEAEKIAKEVGSGKDMAAAARQDGLDAVTAGPFTRDGKGAGDALSRAAVQKAFETGKGKAAVAEGGQSPVVVQVQSIETADPGKDPDGLAKIRQALARSVGDDLFSEYTEALKEDYPVNIDSGAIASVVQPDNQP